MTTPNWPEAILFDAGGTLILQDPEEMGRRLGAVIDPTRAHRAHYEAMAEYSDLRLAGEDVDWDWWMERYFTILGVVDPHQAAAKTDHGYGLWNHALEGVGSAIEQLRDSGVRVAVVSNSDGSVRGSLGKAGLLDLFEFVIDSHEVGVSKPNPKIFHAALDRMDLKPSMAWYVGDSVFHDVNGARAAGLSHALLVDPYGLGPTDVSTIGSVAELL
ncbi:MAG TPA: HAD-IA family hydrolase [Acidimicrobiia bacterium]|nr:HAD-IA family hydrolase [Acidimicrobiia bacterium]